MPQPVAFWHGASTGIGFGTARKLAAAGFTVYAGARRVEKMEPPEYAALLLLRRLLPDRVFDGVIRSIYKRFPG
ncbi:MAG: oxidoreductase [Arthrobacter sp.]|nr:oxidoreductase [Arthrobacter sp.]